MGWGAILVGLLIRRRRLISGRDRSVLCRWRCSILRNIFVISIRSLINTLGGLLPKFNLNCKSLNNPSKIILIKIIIIMNNKLLTSLFTNDKVIPITNDNVNSFISSDKE